MVNNAQGDAVSEERKDLTCVNCGCADDTVLAYPMPGDAPALVSHEDARFCVVALRARLAKAEKFEMTIREGYNVGPNADIRQAIRKKNARHDDLDRQVRDLTTRLAAAEDEGERLRSDNNQAHEYLGGNDTIGLVDLAALRAGELARANELLETHRLHIAKLHKEQLERFKQGCAVCGAMNWFVTASGGHSCGSCGNIFDAPIIDTARAAQGGK